MDTNQVYSVGDNGSTSIYRGLSLGSWSTSGGAALAPTTSVTLALTINDTANSGFAVYLNGYTTTINSSTKLNTKNSAIGAEFDGPGDLIFAGTGSSGGSATVYTRVACAHGRQQYQRRPRRRPDAGQLREQHRQPGGQDARTCRT